MKQFEIKSYHFGELAQMYYPECDYQSALRLFREELHVTRGLWMRSPPRGTARNRRCSPEHK